VARRSTEFFTALAERGHEPLLATMSGTVRFDLDDGGDVIHWYVTVDAGNVTVATQDEPADAVVSTDEAMFDAAVSGRSNAMAAVLRGDIDVVGNLGLLVVFQRLFPGPPASVRTP
jgi:putative sterol carrier protein